MIQNFFLMIIMITDTKYQFKLQKLLNPTMYTSRTSSLPNKNMSSDQPIRPIQIPCRFHSGSVCLNYCNQKSCYKLLCEECIEQHLDHHKKNDLASNSIKSFKKIRQNCVQKLNRLIEQLIGRISNLKQPKNPQQILDQANLKFETIKKVMFEIIEQELIKFYEQLKLKVNQSFSTIKNLQQVHQNLNKIIIQLKESRAIIGQGTKQISQTIQKVLTMNENIYIDTFAREAASYSQKLAYVDFDISINQNKFKTSVTDSLKIIRNQNQDQNNVSFAKSNKVSMQKNLFHPMNSPINKYQSVDGIDIKIQSDVKILHFFQTGSNFLHIIDVSNPNIKIQEKSLQNYIVPSFHASIMTSQGYIFISGGIDDNEEKSKKISKYSLKPKGSQSFKIDFANVIARSSHSLCQYGDYLYIFGGYGSEMKNNDVEVQKSVQKVNIRTGKVEIETKSRYGGANISIAINGAIVKSSEEGVQIYNITSKKWTVINTPSNYLFIRGCGWTRTSKESIIIYGGYDENQDGIDTCQQWTVSQTEILIRNLKFALPFKEGFLNNPGIVVDGSIYAIQNICIEEEDESQTGIISQSERKLLCFYQNKWKQVKI